MEKRRNFKPEEKAKIVLEVLREERTLTEIGQLSYEVSTITRTGMPISLSIG